MIVDLLLILKPTYILDGILANIEILNQWLIIIQYHKADIHPANTLENIHIFYTNISVLESTRYMNHKLYQCCLVEILYQAS